MTGFSQRRPEADPAPARASAAVIAPLVVLAVLAAAFLWFRPLGSSLWLDETGTFWTIKDGPAAAFDRAFAYQGQSPFYYLVEWLSSRALGTSEIALRTPSLLFMAIAAWLVYRIGRRLFETETALIAVVVFVSAGSIAFAAADARPYALAIMLACGAGLALVRWVQGYRPGDGVAYVLLASAMVYAHYAFAPIVLAHLVYGALVIKDRPSRLRSLIAGGGVVASCLPLAGRFLSLLDRGTSLSWPDPPNITGLFVVLIIAVAIALGFLVRRSGDVPVTVPGRDVKSIALLAAWAALPPLLILLVSATTPIKFFHSRYYVSSGPAAALILAWCIRGVRQSTLRLGIVLAITVATVASSNPLHSDERWRQALAHASSQAADATTPVLISSGFIEGRQLAWLSHPERASFLLAPVAYYGVRGIPIPLPFDAEAERGSYVARTAGEIGAAATRVVLVANYKDPFSEVIARRLDPMGYRIRFVRTFGTLIVITYQRGEAP